MTDAIDSSADFYSWIKQMGGNTMITPRDSAALVDSLIKNTTIQESSLACLGLRVLSSGFRVLVNYQLEAFFEVSTCEAGKLKQGVSYNPGVSLYDERGNILSIEKTWLESDEFTGFGSYSFWFNTDGIALEAKKARFFIS